MSSTKTIEELSAELKEITLERDTALSLLMPYALQFSCIKYNKHIDDFNRCNECHNCKSYNFVVPIIKWIEKGWTDPLKPENIKK